MSTTTSSTPQFLLVRRTRSARGNERTGFDGSGYDIYDATGKRVSTAGFRCDALLYVEQQHGEVLRELPVIREVSENEYKAAAIELREEVFGNDEIYLDEVVALEHDCRIEGSEVYDLHLAGAALTYIMYRLRQSTEYRAPRARKRA